MRERERFLDLTFRQPYTVTWVCVWGGGAYLLHKQEGARELYKTREEARERERDTERDRQTENKFLFTMVMEYSMGYTRER